MMTGTAGILPAFGASGECPADRKPALPVCTLILPPELRDQLRAEACVAFPRECCGLIEGARRGNVIEAVRLHPMRNLAQEADRFEIDPAEHIRLLRALRGSAHEIVGCYHSHSNGAAIPSPYDRARAGEENFVWLIAAVAPSEIDCGAFLFRDGAFAPLQIITG